jgi:hypothetical protein
MKTLFPSLLLLALLSSCSKGSASSSAQGATGGCPTLNGEYSGSNAAGQSDSFNIATKVEDGKYLYSFSGDGDDANFQPADGQQKRIHAHDGFANMTLSCGGGAVSLTVQPDGQGTMNVKLTDLGNNQVRDEEQGSTIILTKQGTQAPAPAPLPLRGDAACPVFNGEFTGTTPGGASMDIRLSTARSAGITSYSFVMQNGSTTTGQPADGSWIRYQSSDGNGYEAFTCGANTLIVNDRPDGKSEEITEIAPVGQNQLRFSSGGQAFLLNRK